MPTSFPKASLPQRVCVSHALGGGGTLAVEGLPGRCDTERHSDRRMWQWRER